MLPRAMEFVAGQAQAMEAAVCDRQPSRWRKVTKVARSGAIQAAMAASRAMGLLR